MSRERVLVAVLAGDHSTNTSITQMWGTLPLLNNDDGHPYLYDQFLVDGCRSQELARNKICKHFLASECETLVMIDNDMRVWVDEGLVQLVSTPDYDIVGSFQVSFKANRDEETGEVYPSITPCTFVWDKKERGHRLLLPGTEPVVDCDAVGSGMFAIKRRVLEDERMLLDKGWDPPAYFRTRFYPNYTRKRGNDIDFCSRAREAGYRIRCNWAARTGHIKHIDLCSIETYAKNQFVLGYETGAKHALQMEDEKGRPASGRSRGFETLEADDGEVASVQVDRAGQASR